MKKNVNDNGTLRLHKRREDIMDNATVARSEGSGKRSSFMDEIKDGQRVLKTLEEHLESRDPSMRETAEAAVDTLRALADSIDLAKHVMPVNTGKEGNHGKSRKVPRYRMPQKSEEAGTGLFRCPDGVGDKVIVSQMPGSAESGRKAC